MNKRFAGKASAVNLVSHLTKKGFKPDSAKMAAASYADSVAFVREQLGEYNFNKVNWESTHTKDDNKQNVTDRKDTTSKYDQTENNMREIQIPLPGVSWPILKAEIPMNQTTWDQLIAMSQAMKPALVTDKNKSNESENVNGAGE